MAVTPHEESALGEAAHTASEADGSVLGLDNVVLALPIAGVGSRVLAGLLDYLIQFVIQIIWLFVLGGSVIFGGARGWWSWGVYLLGVFLIDWGYFSASEIFLSQQTLGKKAVQLRVVTREGGTPSVASLLVRNLARSVDLMVGVVLIALDPLGRRLGDRLAGTLVVHEVQGPGFVVGRVPDGWGASEISVVESLFEREPEMEPHRAEQLAQRLLESLRQRHPEFLVGIDPSGPALDTLRRAFLTGRS
jgi:uncharacterized RDD family membrane protein YckC